MKTDRSQKELVEKRQTLQQVKEQLKEEFFGIDHIIDGVIDDLSSWYLFPELQKRPLVINLWGMTGTGKTSLIQRLSELIGFKERLYAFDMQKSENQKVQGNLENILDHNDGQPMMLLFDEFQHMRSLDSNGKHLENNLCQIVWKVLDNGKFEVSEWEYGKEQVARTYTYLEKAVIENVRAERGLVISNARYFMKLLNISFDHDDHFNIGEADDQFNRNYPIEQLRFLDKGTIQTIANLKSVKEVTEIELKERFDQMDHIETLEYLKRLLKELFAPTIADCTKAVVFVVGNLDEAYPMSGEMNPDIDADFMHEKSLEISISDIKECLRLFLRLEQISRLGNIHHVYPALSKKAYQQVITYELNRIAGQVEEEYGVKLIFTQPLEQMLYEEGVYPAQGIRPLLSTIGQQVRSRLGDVLGEAILNGWNPLTYINWEYKTGNYYLTYFNKRSQLGKGTLQAKGVLSALREGGSEEKKVVVSTHEAGHAVVYRVLFGSSPEVIFGATAGSDMEGFVLTKGQEVHSRPVVLKRLAVLVAGYVAEKEVFGPEAITPGASMDIENARGLARTMITQWSLQRYRRSTVYSEAIVNRDDQDLISEMREVLNEAFSIAESVLTKHSKAHIALSSALIKRKSLTKEAIEDVIRAHAPELQESTLVASSKGYYMSRFKEALKGIS